MRYKLVKSIFVPGSRIQGADVPVHILWNEQVNVAVQISFPSDVMFLKEVYNVKGSGIDYINGRLLLSEFERNGYAGLLFGTKISEEPAKTCLVEIIVQDLASENEDVIRKRILLFRPKVVVNWPRRISVISKDEHIMLKDKIFISNEGLGTAIISLNISEDSDVVVRRPEEIEGYLEQFGQAVNENLNAIKEEFPSYSQLIDDFICLITDLIKHHEVFTEEYLSKMHRILDGLRAAFSENEEFARAVADAMINAYLSSLPSIALHLRALLEYLNSMITHRIILSGATLLLEMKPGLNKFKGHLTITDLACNYYSPIEFSMEVNVVANRRIKIPLYMLFHMGPQEG